MYEQFPFEGYYVFICTDSDNSIEKREQVRHLHVARLNVLRQEGRLLLAGPLLDNQNLSIPIGGLIIAKFNSFEEAQQWLNDEPYLKAGAYQEVAIKAYKDVFAYQK
jgi:uncharacterized protein YciI